ncbi:MAG: hypothetical protein U5N56_05725 [Candidatus Marinimicrobia bacterium]|nr:hypothetical protein [Candidatus Neomarinimicrobiota bacterium]
MKTRSLHLCLLSVLLFAAASCFLFESKPETVDGNLSIRLRFTLPSDIDSTTTVPVSGLRGEDSYQ